MCIVENPIMSEVLAPVILIPVLQIESDLETIKNLYNATYTAILNKI